MFQRMEGRYGTSCGVQSKMKQRLLHVMCIFTYYNLAANVTWKDLVKEKILIYINFQHIHLLIWLLLIIQIETCISVLLEAIISLRRGGSWSYRGMFPLWWCLEVCSTIEGLRRKTVWTAITLCIEMVMPDDILQSNAVLERVLQTTGDDGWDCTQDRAIYILRYISGPWTGCHSIIGHTHNSLLYEWLFIV